MCTEDWLSALGFGLSAREGWNHRRAFNHGGHRGALREAQSEFLLELGL
jgi:hypothetical protein